MPKMFDEQGNPRFPVFDITLDMAGKGEILIDGEPAGWTSGVQVISQPGELTQVIVVYPAEKVHFRGPAAHVRLLQLDAPVRSADGRMVALTSGDCHSCGASRLTEAAFCYRCGKALEIKE